MKRNGPTNTTAWEVRLGGQKKGKYGKYKLVCFTAMGTAIGFQRKNTTEVETVLTI